MGIERKISRNVLKKQQGNNKIRKEWENFMNFKYSVGELEKLRIKNKRRRK